VSVQHKPIQFLAVNCVNYRNLCSLFSIHGYPTLKLLRPSLFDREFEALLREKGEIEASKLERVMYEYSGSRTAKDLVEFVLGGWEKLKGQQQEWKYPHVEAKWVAGLFTKGITVFRPGSAEEIAAVEVEIQPRTDANGADSEVRSRSAYVGGGANIDSSPESLPQLAQLSVSNPSSIELSSLSSPRNSVSSSWLTSEYWSFFVYFFCAVLFCVVLYWFKFGRFPWHKTVDLGGMKSMGMSGLGGGGSKEV